MLRASPLPFGTFAVANVVYTGSVRRHITSDFAFRNLFNIHKIKNEYFLFSAYYLSNWDYLSSRNFFQRILKLKVKISPSQNRTIVLFCDGFYLETSLQLRFLAKCTI